MKIGVILTTRGRPRQAAAVIESARYMASGKHDVRFAVALDEDDLASVHFFKAYDARITLSIEPRPPGIPACWNRCVPLLDCDAYLAVADDGFFATVDWDDIAAKHIATAFPRPELAAFAWTDTANPGQPTILMASREWIALTGSFMDDRFPFWFSDTAFGETWSFVTGRFMSMVPNLIILSRPGIYNPRARDMDFWWDFFVWTRQERMDRAAEIRGQLGINLNQPVLDRLAAQWGERDAFGRKNGALVKPDTRPPSPEYVRAKAEAEHLMGVRAAA
ncbi:hypothetical protein [uncultured Bradyrhizobium sp.]|uniref:hypothetical protein n=1 Tax=uncultured Bradyrhizobium sp. TaxID=199684 RepID=UPI0026231BB0|nr:hypothetical protein [uncultured Bradyrhizobium sp.]